MSRMSPEDKVKLVDEYKREHGTSTAKALEALSISTNAYYTAKKRLNVAAMKPGRKKRRRRRRVMTPKGPETSIESALLSTMTHEQRLRLVISICQAELDGF